MQRIEVARLPPLGADLSAYLQCRAAAVGRQLDEFITAEGVDELRTRLTANGTSLLNPLNVNNWISAALNTAADLGAPVVDRDVIRAV
jgi:type II secretory pathway predicted ATPase ExeA